MNILCCCCCKTSIPVEQKKTAKQTHDRYRYPTKMHKGKKIAAALARSGRNLDNLVESASSIAAPTPTTLSPLNARSITRRLTPYPHSTQYTPSPRADLNGIDVTVFHLEDEKSASELGDSHLIPDTHKEAVLKNTHRGSPRKQLAANTPVVAESPPPLPGSLIISIYDEEGKEKQKTPNNVPKNNTAAPKTS